MSLPGLPEGVQSKTINIRDLNIHFLQAGNPGSPLIVLLHGFPELAYSWRRVLVPLSQFGFFVIAPDQRGYGRTTSSASSGATKYDDDLSPFRMVNLVHDIVASVHGLGYEQVTAVVGHDFGSNVAAHCALIRPDLFKAVVCMSAPFAGPPSHPVVSAEPDAHEAPRLSWTTLGKHLAAIHPPMKHYVQYFCGPTANDDMLNAPQGLHAFLRGYFHMKSADWPFNNPHPLAEPSQIVKLPHYYLMPAHHTMAQVVHAHEPSAAEVLRNTWLPDDELAVYVEEYGRTGFQGGLNWYRGMTNEKFTDDMGLFAGKKVRVPTLFIGGAKDWGVYQTPGALDKMKAACPLMGDIELIAGAGHWVQQERPIEVVSHLQNFLEK